MVQLPLGNVKLLNIKIELRLHEAFRIALMQQSLLEMKGLLNQLRTQLQGKIWHV